MYAQFQQAGQLIEGTGFERLQNVVVEVQCLQRKHVRKSAAGDGSELVIMPAVLRRCEKLQGLESGRLQESSVRKDQMHHAISNPASMARQNSLHPQAPTLSPNNGHRTNRGRSKVPSQGMCAHSARQARHEKVTSS
jgi:hypothetical protein